MEYILAFNIFIENKLGLSSTIILSILAISLVVLRVFFTKRKDFFDILRNNKDIRGKSYSWKNTFLGIAFFLLSIPVTIGVVLYAYGFWGDASTINSPEWISSIGKIIFPLILIVGVIYLIIVENRRAK